MTWKQFQKLLKVSSCILHPLNNLNLEKSNLESVFCYYLNFEIPEVFHMRNTSAEKLF